MPIGLSPRKRPGDVQSSPGRSPCSCASSWAEGLGQARVAERLLRQLHQLGPLLGGHRVEHPLGRGGPLGQQVDQLVGALRVLREELAVRAHELARTAPACPAPAAWFCEQGVQVVEHLPDPLDVLRRHVLHRLLHPGEALVEHLPAEQVADLLVGLAGLGRAPVVGVELADRAAGVGRQRVELHLAEAGVVGVSRSPARSARPPARDAAARGPPAACRRAGCRAAGGCAAATPGGSGRRAPAARRARAAAAPAAPSAATSPP